MQTFLPYREYLRSAQVLDYKRLGKQRPEVKQILRGLLGETSGWTSHPANKMWAGYESALVEYGLTICTEWERRGYKDNVGIELLQLRTIYNLNDSATPLWLGDERLHRSHRSNLLRKNEAYYRGFGWTETSDLPYFWPSQHSEYARHRPSKPPAPLGAIDDGAAPLPYLA